MHRDDSRQLLSLRHSGVVSIQVGQVLEVVGIQFLSRRRGVGDGIFGESPDLQVIAQSFQIFHDLLKDDDVGAGCRADHDLFVFGKGGGKGQGQDQDECQCNKFFHGMLLSNKTLSVCGDQFYGWFCCRRW